jgi:hypothetical protein
MMPFGGGNYTSGNPASSNKGGNVGDNQLVNQRGNHVIKESMFSKDELNYLLDFL